MSFTNESCLITAVGVTKTSCECFNDYPIGFDISDSGLYLDQLTPLEFLSGLNTCQDGDLWDMINDKRQEAVNIFNSDIAASLLENNTLKRPVFNGKIGGTRSNKTIATRKTYSGLRMYCADVRSGTLLIKSVGGVFDSNGTKDVYIYNNKGELLHTETFNFIANVYQNITFATPIEIQLHDEDIENVEIFIFYENDTMKPKANELSSCGCFHPVFHTQKPYFNKYNDQRYYWSKWLMCGGYEFDNITDLSDPNISYSASSLLYGLTADVELKCNVDEILCSRTVDYSSDPVMKAVAIAIRFKFGELVVNKMLSGTNFNYQNMINHEAWIGFKAEFMENYSNLITYIAKNVDITGNDCYMCKELYKGRNQPLY